jgi:hypothetical protein
MAITRAQIARELYIKGGVVNPDGRRGFFKGAQADASKGKGSMSPGTSGLGGSQSTGYGRDQGNQGDQQGDMSIKDFDPNMPNPDGSATYKFIEPPKKPKETNVNKFKRAITKYGPFSYLDELTNSKLARFNNSLQRQNYIDSLDLDNPEEKEEYDRIMNQLGGLGMDIIAGPTDLENTTLSVPPSMLATDPMTQFKTVDGVSTLGDPGVSDVLGEGYEEYLDRFKTTDSGGGDDQVIDPCKGPNPPAYCFVGDDTEEDTTPKRNLGGLAPRFAGSIFDFTGLADGGRAGMMDGGMMEDTPEGGIMDLESGRQMYFLGKLVKKATRAVKKVAKSPLGKAALMYGLGSLGAGFLGKAQAGTGTGFFSGLKGKLFGQAASKAAGPMKYLQGTPFTEGLLGKLGITKGGGSMMPTLGGGISLGLGIPFALDALGVGKEEDDKIDLDEYYRKNSINIADIRNNPYNFLAPRFAADGGLMRMGYQEGGDAEPVAKKTMPLLDMDGMEKDYREEGGFVPIGRMERADDVPARLSKNEFVFTADAVRNAGEGDIDKGAEVMYNMMKNLESGGEVSEESQGLDGAREMFKTSQRLEEVL